MAKALYLDNAATSHPKPGAVYDAVDRYHRELGAAVGRGAYAGAVEVQRTVDRCRQKAATILGAESPERIVFTFNGTDSLNLAIHGLLRAGDHVVTSVVEHNSVLRPLKAAQERLGVEVSYVDCDDTGRIEPARVRDALQDNTRLVAILHASNVTGTLQPIADIGAIAREAEALFLVDAAQSVGHVAIDLSKLSVDLLACPGHKGLLGPLGTGLLYIGSHVDRELRSTRQGGTGSNSEDDRQPESLPDKYESGNHNAPGLVGLEAGLSFLQDRGVDDVRRHEIALTEQFLDGVRELSGIEVHGDTGLENRVGVVSITHPEFEPHVLATLLDEHFGIQTRAGLHCAPKIHERLGTIAGGGTVRFSFGPFNTGDHIDAALTALREITGG